MPRAAIALLERERETFPGGKLVVLFNLVTLEVRAGRVEQAVGYLDGNRADLDAQIARSPGVPVVVGLVNLRGVVGRLLGDYPAARAALPAPAYPAPPRGFDPARPVFRASARSRGLSASRRC